MYFLYENSFMWIQVQIKADRSLLDPIMTFFTDAHMLHSAYPDEWDELTWCCMVTNYWLLDYTHTG